MVRTFVLAVLIVAASGCSSEITSRPETDGGKKPGAGIDASCGSGTLVCGNSCCSGAQQCIRNACCDVDQICGSGEAAVCCSAGRICSSSGTCVGSCTRQCTGKMCGDDGCGGSCGTCSATQTCDASGACVSEFIRGLYIDTGSYWNGTRIVLTAADLEGMGQAGITDVYVQVHFADSSKMGYASSLRPVVQFFKGSGIRVHAWSCPGPYDPTDNSPSSDNQKVIAGVTDIYANAYGMDGVTLDEFWFPGTASKHPNATQIVTEFHKTVFNIVKAHGGIATFCATPEYGVAASVYGVDYAAIGTYCDYITPMAYVGDFAGGDPAYVGKVVAGIQAKTSAKVFPVLESYKSDRDVTPKSVATLNAEVESGLTAGAPGYALFRFGLLTGYPTAGPR